MSHPANLGQLIAHTAGEYHQYLIDIRWLRGILDLVAANSKTEGKSCRRGGAAASPFTATFCSVGGPADDRGSNDEVYLSGQCGTTASAVV